MWIDVQRAHLDDQFCVTFLQRVFLESVSTTFENNADCLCLLIFSIISTISAVLQHHECLYYKVYRSGTDTGGHFTEILVSKKSHF